MAFYLQTRESMNFRLKRTPSTLSKVQCFFFFVSRFLSAKIFVLCLVGCASDYKWISPHNVDRTHEIRNVLHITRSPESVGIAPEVLRKMERQLELAITRKDIPGATLWVGRKSKVVAAKALGRLGWGSEQNRPTSLDTVYDLASLSKVLGTATVTLALVEEGRLRLEDHVAGILPEFARQGKADITVFDLLTHQSGLKAYEDPSRVKKYQGGASSSEALYNYISHLPKLYPSGDYCLYSCLNYLILARLNESVAGVSQETFLRERVWKPLGMDETTYFPTKEQQHRLAPTSREQSLQGTSNEIHDPLARYYGASSDHVPGNAGIFSTAGDLAIFCQMILNEGQYGGTRVFKPETVQLMTRLHSSLPFYTHEHHEKAETQHYSHRALGWVSYDKPPYAPQKAVKGAAIGHTGYTGTYFWIDRESQSFIVLLTNAVYAHEPPRLRAYRERITATYLEGIYGAPR